MSKAPADLFTEDMANHYDERNRQLAPITDALHFLIRLVLKDLPSCSRVLCVGVGTGAEIFSLAKAFPEWTFVALDPSLAMLNACRKRVESSGLAERCEFVHGYVQDLPLTQEFDAALSILVAHFVKREERVSFYRAMTDRLRNGGYLINTEISFDLSSQEFPSMLKGWEAVQKLMGATTESLAALPKVLKEVLSIISPADTESLLRQSGIAVPVRFYQALMISGWYGKKEK